MRTQDTTDIIDYAELIGAIDADRTSGRMIGHIIAPDPDIGLNVRENVKRGMGAGNERYVQFDYPAQQGATFHVQVLPDGLPKDHDGNTRLLSAEMLAEEEEEGVEQRRQELKPRLESTYQPNGFSLRRVNQHMHTPEAAIIFRVSLSPKGMCDTVVTGEALYTPVNGNLRSIGLEVLRCANGIQTKEMLGFADLLDELKKSPVLTMHVIFPCDANRCDCNLRCAQDGTGGVIATLEGLEGVDNAQHSLTTLMRVPSSIRSAEDVIAVFRSLFVEFMSSAGKITLPESHQTAQGT